MMIVRIVHLHFDPDSVMEAASHIREVAPKVRQMPGCAYLEILQDVHHPATWTTYSHWDSESDLNAYRDSATFREFWKKVKPLFAVPARAWSSRKHDIPGL